MFLNISADAVPEVWLSLFPSFSGGEHVPPLEAPETLGVPRVPPFPPIFFTDTFGRYGNQGEVTP